MEETNKLVVDEGQKISNGNGGGATTDVGDAWGGGR